MTTAEILWMVHAETIEYLKSEKPRDLRRYLILMGDEVSLRAWDKEQMEGGKKKP